MAITRKQNRVSYAEDSDSGADDFHGPEAKTTTEGTISAAGAESELATTTDVSVDAHVGAGGRGAAPTLPKRKRGKHPVQADNEVPIAPKAVFDYGKILLLPHDILCAILSYLHPRDLYNLSVSCKRMAGFLHSRKSTSVWVAARKRLTIYVPSNFINAKDTHEVGGRNFLRLQHYPFRRRGDGTNAAGDNNPLEEQELDDEENDDCKIPLSVPEPPPGVSEFSLARYLFHNTCKGCGILPRAKMTKVPELVARFCKSCSSNYLHPLQAALVYFENRTLSAESDAIPVYHQFLLAQLYWFSNGDSRAITDGRTIPCAKRRIYTHPLDQAYRDYQEKQASMSGLDFNKWYNAKMAENEDRRTAAAKMAEYCWLKATYGHYIRRVSLLVEVRNQKRAKQGIIERMQLETHYSLEDLTCALEPTDIIPWISDMWKLDQDGAWQMAKPEIVDLMSAYTVWVHENPLLRWKEVADMIADWHIDHGAQLDQYLPDFSTYATYGRGILLGMPRTSHLLHQGFDNYPEEERLQQAEHELERHADVYFKDFLSVVDKIRRDLVRIVYKDEAVDACDNMSARSLCECLDLPTTYFECTECHEFAIPWLDVPSHACFSSDPGFFTFRMHYKLGNYLHLWGTTKERRGKFIGWQPQRVRLDRLLSGTMHLRLPSILGESRNEIEGELQSIPETHSALRDTDYWFKCTVEHCDHRLPVLFHDMVRHMTTHIYDYEYESLEVDDIKTKISPVLSEPPV